MATVYIGLGGNLGDREGMISHAVQRLSAVFGEVETSSLYESEPVGYADQPCFLNAVVRSTTEVEPHDVLATLQRIELDLGRERSFRNAPRTIDLDLLFYDDLMLDAPDLTVPHPRLHERLFVLVPLVEIAPDLVHPRLQRTLRELHDDLGPDRSIWKHEPE